MNNNWLKETKTNIQNLKKAGYFNSWKIQETEFIVFHICPKTLIPENWIEKRAAIYKINAEKLKVTAPKINFYVYPSLDFGEKIGITPAISFIKDKEIHGHINQSPGHELTHMLLGEINSTDNLPANGLWSEGICVYLDGTNTDRHKHVNSLNYSNEIFAISWENWKNNLPNNLYPLAGSIIQYLDEQYGWNNISLFLKKIKNHNDNQLLIELFKFSCNELRNNWYSWLKKARSI